MRRWAAISGVLLALVAVVSVIVVQAQRSRGQRTAEPVLSVEDYTPRSTLVVDANPVPRARFPVVDVHSHHWPGFSARRLDEIAGEMDELNLAVLVNLSGGSGGTLERCVDTVAGSRHPRRMVCFANLDFRGGVGPGFGERAAAQLERDVAAGAAGLKFFKNFGIDVRDRRGARVPVDDPELDPVFETAGRLGIPVLMHVGEPQSFYEPVDRFNERWLELTLLPDRRLPADRYPSFETMTAERDRRFARHPDTTFIAAHMGWHANDLGRLGEPCSSGCRTCTPRRLPFCTSWAASRGPPVRSSSSTRIGSCSARTATRRRSSPTIGARSRPPTSTSTTTGGITPSGRCTAWICRTRCCGRSTTGTPSI